MEEYIESELSDIFQIKLVNKNIAFVFSGDPFYVYES